MTGTEINDYLHPMDHNDLSQVLTITPSELAANAHLPDFTLNRSFRLRMKCVLAKRNAGLTSAGFKVIHCNGHLKVKTLIHTDGLPYCQNLGLLAFAYAIPSPNANNTEIRLGLDMFMFRASLDFKLIFLETKIASVTGFQPQELVDKSLYHLVHSDDANGLRQSHQTLLVKGQSTTPYYRLLTKQGGCVWLQSYMAIVHNSRSSRPNCVVSVNYILSKVESSVCSFQLDTGRRTDLTLNSDNDACSTDLDSHPRHGRTKSDSRQSTTSTHTPPPPTKRNRKQAKQRQVSTNRQVNLRTTIAYEQPPTDCQFLQPPPPPPQTFVSSSYLHQDTLFLDTTIGRQLQEGDYLTTDWPLHNQQGHQPSLDWLQQYPSQHPSTNFVIQRMPQDYPTHHQSIDSVGESEFDQSTTSLSTSPDPPVPAVPLQPGRNNPSEFVAGDDLLLSQQHHPVVTATSFSWTQDQFDLVSNHHHHQNHNH